MAGGRRSPSRQRAGTGPVREHPDPARLPRQFIQRFLTSGSRVRCRRLHGRPGGRSGFLAPENRRQPEGFSSPAATSLRGGPSHSPPPRRSHAPMSTATTTSTDTGQHTSPRGRQHETQQPTTQTERSAANRLRTTMAAVRLAFTWLGVRRTLAPEQRTTAARAFHADREFLSAGKNQLDRRRDQELLPAGGTARRAAHSGRVERRARGCHSRRQDRRSTSVGLGQVPLG